MADFIAKLKVDSKEYDSKIERARSGLLALEKNLKETGKDFTKTDEAQIKFVQDLGKMETVSRTATGRVNEMSKAFIDLSVQYKHMSDLERNSPIGKAMAASLNQLKGRIASAKTELAGIQQSLAGGGGVGSKFAAGLGSAFSMFGPAALAATGVAAALGGMKKVMSDMVQINMQFEQGTAVLASILGKTTDEITALTNQAKQLGATTRYTAMQITELQTNLARLGFTEQEILNSTKAIQAFATATGADLGEAANLAGAALRGFGMNATEMERAASVMAVSTTKSALSFEKLATAVPIVAPVAKQFGFTIEDTITLLGKLSDAGMDASTAATATRNIFLKMADGSGKLSQAMGKPVHSVEEFGEALKEMKEKGMSLNDILKMVGVRSTAAFAVFADNADTLKDFKQSITDCGDAMGDMEQKQINTLQGSLVILNSAWEGLMLTFSESNGTIKKVVDSLTNLLGAWTRWRKRNAGGDEAIKSYQLYGDGLTKEAQKKANDLVSGYRAGGTTDEQMVAMFDKEKKALEDQSEEMQKVYEEYRKIRKENGLLSQEMDALAPKIKKAFALNFDPTAMGRKEWDNLMTSRMAPIYDQIAVKDYQLSLVTPAPVVEDTNGKGKTSEDLTSTSRAEIEAQMLKDIELLDKVNMIKLGKEQEYEDKVFAIKEEAYERIKQLYAADSKEYAQMKAKIAQLKIQHQGTTLRLSNQGSKKTYETLTGPSGYSQEGISALRKEIQGSMKSMQIGSDEYMFQAERLVDLTTFENLLNTAVQSGLSINPATLERLFEGIDNATFAENNIELVPSITDEEWQNLVSSINEKLKSLGIDPIELDVTTGGVSTAKEGAKATADAWQNAVAAVNNVGDALQSLEDPSAKVAGIVMQAIANIALGFAQAAASPATGAAGVFGWIAAATAGVATMVATIETIKSATGFATGGMVEGNSYSGDNIVARLNAGEGVLTARGVETAAAMANNVGIGNLHLSTEISGTNLRVVLNNDNRSKGGSRGYYANIH